MRTRPAATTREPTNSRDSPTKNVLTLDFLPQPEADRAMAKYCLREIVGKHVVVCGGRYFRDRERIFAVLDTYHADHGPIGVIAHGDAPGADRLAGAWALERGVSIWTYPAEWDRHGKAAGPIRNSEMLRDGPDVVIAFPGGRGTRDMCNQATQMGFPLIEIAND